MNTDDPDRALEEAEKARSLAETIREEAASLAMTLLVRRQENHFGPLIRAGITGEK